MNTYEPILKAILLPFNWRLQNEELSLYDLKELRKKLEAFYDRADDFARCAFRIAEEEEGFLREEDYLEIEDAYERMAKLLRYAEDAIDVIDEILKSWEDIENDLRWLYQDAAKVLKKAV